MKNTDRDVSRITNKTMSNKPSIWKRIANALSVPVLIRNGETSDKDTYSAKSLNVHFGIPQRTSSKIAKKLGIPNVGTAKNPRYFNADAKRIIRNQNIV